MRKLIIISILFFSYSLSSQTAFLNTGINSTSYDYKNSEGNSNENIKSSNGSFFELGYSFPIEFSKRARSFGRYSRLHFKTALTLNQYNATGGNTLDNYDWDSQYIGLRSDLEYFLLGADFLVLSMDAGLGLEVFLNGKQKIGGNTYNLKESDEFNGLYFTPRVGLNLSVNVSEEVALMGGINLSKAISASKSDQESVSFNNSQFRFGIIIQIY
ncbi:MAG: hypothetical protein ACKVJW_07995 [Flavobacteriales bacterium]|jgi:hypothetical protein|tara:strand:+ start:432 stop:1073 length:642 start_codon:yes stop_codon:yes gene_type:complete